MNRILCIISSMNAGGAETFLMKIYRNIDKSKYKIDFCVNSSKNIYSDEIYSYGGKLFVTSYKSKHPIKSFFDIVGIVKENNYNYVIRINEHSLSTIDLIAAKIGGAKKLIMRSSNSSSGSGFSIFLHKCFKFLPILIPDIKIAPSKLSANYTFGTKFRQNNIYILKNGLNLSQYKYSMEHRVKLRKELNISDKYVIGHVGRFDIQKNHDYLLRVFNELCSIDDKYVLLLVGDGPERKNIAEKARNMQIYDKCIFTGIRKDVDKIYSAMDMFVFTSYYEGMPNTVIEAQTSGLSCVVANTITSEVNVYGNVHFESLEQNAKEWANRIVKLEKECKDYDRSIAYKRMKENGYDIADVCDEFVDIVFNS